MKKVVYRSKEDYINPKTSPIDLVNVSLPITAWKSLFEYLLRNGIIEENGMPTDWAVDQGFVYALEYQSAEGEHIVDSWVISHDYLDRYLAWEASKRCSSSESLCENALNGRCHAAE